MIIAVLPAVIVSFITQNMWYGLLIFLLGIGFGYAVIVFFLERFIYRKIKLIYKNMHRMNTEHLDVDATSADPIENVSDDLSNWARSSREEINELKMQATFRREFVGNISHELKTPLFQIQGYVHTLMEGALTDPAVNYRFLEKTVKSVDRLVVLVNDLSSISEIESGEMKMKAEKFDVHKLVEEVYEDVLYLVKKSGQTLGFKTGSDVNLKAHADRLKIKQALINLVVNAIKYGRLKGSVKCGLYDMDAYILVEITDDGNGIPAESLTRVFERFYRVEKSRNRDDGGSGLGLSIAKHIIEAHGQSIHAKSEEGKGTTLSFTLKKAK